MQSVVPKSLSSIFSFEPIARAEDRSFIFGLDWSYEAVSFRSRDFGAYRVPRSILHAESSFVIHDDALFHLDLSHRNYDPLWWFREHDSRRWDVNSESSVVSVTKQANWPVLPDGIFLPPMTNFGHFMFEMLPRLVAGLSLGVSRVVTTTQIPKR